MKALFLAAALLVGCGVSRPFQASSTVWAMNNSGNDYVVVLFDSTAWSLPAHTGGVLTTGNGGQIEVLDADNCVAVADAPLAGDVLVDVDERGAVDFVRLTDRPRLGELQSTTACGAIAPTL